MPVGNTYNRPEKTWLMMRIFRFISQRPLEAFLVLRMASWVAWLSLVIKFNTLPHVLSFIAISPRENKPDDLLLTQQRLAHLVDALLGLNVLCFTPTCWKRAPVLHRYLALNGIETRIVFGVRKDEEESLLAGHAWLEADGHPLLESSPPQYTPTYSFPA